MTKNKSKGENDMQTLDGIHEQVNYELEIVFCPTPYTIVAIKESKVVVRNQHFITQNVSFFKNIVEQAVSREEGDEDVVSRRQEEEGDQLQEQYQQAPRRSTQNTGETNFYGHPINSGFAWQYVTKTDHEYSRSDGHPDLTNGEPLKTDSASAAIVKGREESDSEGDNATGQRSRKRKKWLTSLEVADIIQSKSIKTRTELLALAQLHKDEGKL
ncbi:Hypothetical predicted protein [Paramuricea clavata]|uniref:Uncharacterized protein n=1 Tax=Paramuricea clavata TaxID=317549 RepID=A0A6S7GNM2_PARCT|nr:Hypothetical predicted protein [Paramuricea clavata]